MSYESVHDYNQIDLNRHGLIEASAGTGKTYTIENLVIRLLKERDDVELENILLVTFTEKAASELKIRIHEKLEEELDNTDQNATPSKKLGNTLDTFDRASIYTIHGFCQTVLRDFAFENSTIFQNEVINDAPLFETLLKEQMRGKWQETYKDTLKELLEISRFNNDKGYFLDTVTGLAKSIHEETGDRLLPNLMGMDFKKAQQEITSICLEIKDLTGSDGEFSNGYARLNFHASSKKSIIEKIVIPLEAYFSRDPEARPDIRGLVDLMAQIRGTKSSGRKGIECLIPTKWKQNTPNLEVCPNLEQVKQRLEELDRRLNVLRYGLAVESIHRLQDDVKLTKQGHGWISYYDMLSLVEKAVHSDNSSTLLEKLRNRFRVAFIDEFQDTDTLQWQIFKKIFIGDHDDLHNLLFVIGDPKQAIYAFRGADVYAYLSARNEMERLVKKDKARLYSLSINWRSQPEMIMAFNKLFCSKAWFKPQDQAEKFEIGYQETGFPCEKDRTGMMVADDSGRPVLNIMELSNLSPPRLARSRLAGFIAHEIKHLISSDIIIKDKGGDEQRIGFGDICILVRSKSDVPFIEEQLTRLEIPYSFYKKPGLFLSDEALFISLAFHAILDPGDSSEVKKALLSPFFGLPLQDLFAYDEMPPSHPVKQMLFKWSEYALSRKWSYLFQSLIEDSGLLSRETAGDKWDRKQTNYRQIFEYLSEIAYRKNLDFRGISAILDIYRKQSLNMDEDIDIHQIETEAQKVLLMTMHVSKGLEFPIVFVAGGLTQPPSHLERYYTYHVTQKGELYPEFTRIVDLAKQDGAERHKVEKRDENNRLYYVASTRAQFKLYLPFYNYPSKASWVGPVCSQLSPALLEAFPQAMDDRDVRWLDADHDHDVSIDENKSDKPVEAAAITKQKAFELFPYQESFLDRKIRMKSYSSLHLKIQEDDVHKYDVSFETHQKERENDERFASQVMDPVHAKGGTDEIPGGTDVGLMFHDILEHIDYKAVLEAGPQGSDSGISDLIFKQMEIHGVHLQWIDAISRVIWNTLTTPVTAVADDFTLSHLSREDRLNEVEFFYPFPVSVTCPAGIPDCETGRGFIRGFVDLIFRKDKKFYIADWKSNYLEDGYGLKSMETSMDQADYHLQYKLYAIAVLRWLKQTMGDRFDPERDFGGVFYFYLRGMSDNNGDGIYFVSPDKLGPLDHIEQEIALRLKMTH